MVFSLYDYLTKCDPLEFNLRLLSVLGFWPIEAKSKTVRILFSIYGLLCMTSLVSLLVLELLDTYLIRHDLYMVTNNLCATSGAFLALSKQMIVSGKIENIQRLHKRLTAFKNSRTDPEDVKIMENATRTIARTTKMMYALGIPCITTWMFYPVLESGNQRKLLLPYRLPIIDLTATPAFEIIYTYQSLTLFSYLTIVFSNDFVYYGMVTLINAEYEILIKNINHLHLIVDPESKNSWDKCDEDTWDTVHDPVVKERARMILRDCYILHQRILEEIQQLKVIYSSVYFAHFIGSVILVGVIIMDIVVVSKGVTLQLLQRVIYSTCGALDTYLCCSFTNKMLEEGLKLRESVYSGPWYKLHPSLRKDLLMVTMKTATPSAVKIGDFIHLNLETFLDFLKLSYNITAVLYQTVNR